MVARDASARAIITTSLSDAGFAIDTFADTPPITGPASVAVWVIERDDEPDTVFDQIRPWLIARAMRRVVVVTWRPLRDVVEPDRDRVAVLNAPVFPWQIVDALRAPGGRW